MDMSYNPGGGLYHEHNDGQFKVLRVRRYKYCSGPIGKRSDAITIFVEERNERREL